jgi:hypothetical protein
MRSISSAVFHGQQQQQQSFVSTANTTLSPSLFLLANRAHTRSISSSSSTAATFSIAHGRVQRDLQGKPQKEPAKKDEVADEEDEDEEDEEATDATRSGDFANEDDDEDDDEHFHGNKRGSDDGDRQLASYIKDDVDYQWVSEAMAEAQLEAQAEAERVTAQLVGDLPQRLAQMMRALDREHDVASPHRLLKALIGKAVSSENFSAVPLLYSKLHELNVQPTDEMLSWCLLAHARLGLASQAYELFERMSIRQVTPSAEAAQALLQCLVSEQRLLEATKAYDVIRSQGMRIQLPQATQSSLEQFYSLNKL